MKKSINILIFGIIISLLGLTSCEDFLESENKGAVSDAEQFSTQEGFETLVNQAYYMLRSIYADPAIYCSGVDTYAGIRDAGDATLNKYTLTSDNSTVKDFYVNLYGIVNAANAVLYYADNCEDYTDKAKRLEEARFIRAYAYYIISQQFGRASIIESYINTAETSYPRSSLEDTYNFIIGELVKLSNSTLLSESDATGRVSKQAVKALLAKVYLAAGWDLQTTLNSAENGTYTIDGTSYFELAASTAKEVTDAISLTQTFEEKWSPDNQQNEEVIFAIQWDRATSLDIVSGGHSQQNNFGTYLGAVTLGMKFVDSDMSPTTKTFYLYEKGDTRYDATFMTTILNFDGVTDNFSTQGYWAYYNATTAAQAELGIAFYYPAWYVTDDEITAFQTANADRFVSTDLSNVSQIIRTADPVRWILYKKDGTISSDNSSLSYGTAMTKVGTIPPIKKFDDPETSIECTTGSGSYRDFVVLNASDIYLVAAEAYLMAGEEGQSLTYLNAVRSRAGASEITSYASYQRYDPTSFGYVSAEQNIDVILDERARELLGEYYRWMDLRRTRQLVKYNIEWNEGFSLSDMTGGDGNIKWLRPIPADEISLNSGISAADQNPGYTAETTEE